MRVSVRCLCLSMRLTISKQEVSTNKHMTFNNVKKSHVQLPADTEVPQKFYFKSFIFDGNA